MRRCRSLWRRCRLRRIRARRPPECLSICRFIKNEEKKMPSEKVQSIISTLDTLSVLEIAELSKALQEHWGVQAAAPVAVGGFPGAGAAGAAAAGGAAGPTAPVV